MEDKERYEETVKRILDRYSENIDAPLFCDCKCEDQWISVEEENGGYKLKRYKKTSKNKKEPVFILILESPHVAEFFLLTEATSINKPRPAKGKTGENIKNYFIKSMTIQMDKWGKCYIYLINAIQYQCSLGLTQNKTNKKIKHDVFNKIWQEGGREKFKERLADVYKSIPSDSPKYIVNACTSLDGIKKDITSAAEETTRETIFQRCHPSSSCFIVEARAYRNAPKEIRVCQARCRK
ncbi:hypothetical protein [Dethiosulfovibrio salsuginis]|uniref:Uncharacterized protein n=1 Tax=Dethiosulfovibrio salsuginis TaxID=561720 RepID=A0A1X7KIZ1_9BACT|nr:hypothetical protein [Dethiosulfovibrio salsuginis]SMG40634.1 hypothetical protein SAMN06275492_12816 [Dethiosulfovibrio salsuginis]